MIRRIAFGLAALAVLLPALAAAQVPKYVNFQSVLRDDGGNLVEDGFVDLTFKILDQDGDELYAEVQPGVQVVRSAVNVMIGEGIVPGSSPAAPTGGIPLNALDPANGNHFLQIQFGPNLPSDPMELGSVPYAMYAETALKIDFNISAGELPPILVTEDELAAAITSAEADDLTTATVFGGDVSGTYNLISVVDDSHNHTGATISGLSTSDFTSANISQWTNDAGYITSSTADSNYVNVTGDTMTGVLNFDGGAGETVRIEPVSGNITTPGTMDGVDVSALESRVAVLEAKPEIVVWAYVTDTDGSLGSKSASGYNIASVVREDHLTLGKVYLITFSNSIGSNYSVTATANLDVNSATRLFTNVPTRGSSSVRVRIKEESGSQDYGSFSFMIVR